MQVTQKIIFYTYLNLHLPYKDLYNKMDLLNFAAALWDFFFLSENDVDPVVLMRPIILRVGD